MAAGASAVRTRAAVPQTDFNRDIRPLFAQHCTACHGGVKAAGKISLVYRDRAITEGKSGKPAIVPGHPRNLGADAAGDVVQSRRPHAAARTRTGVVPEEVAVPRQWIPGRARSGVSIGPLSRPGNRPNRG